MKNRFFVIIVFVFSFFFLVRSGVALASGFYQVTSTPFPTSTPIPTFTPVTTPYSPDDALPTPLSFDCPVGPPFGFGTVTPSVGWSGLCGQCLPVDDLPTSVPMATLTQGVPPTQVDPLDTPFPTFTPYPTFTPFPTATPTFGVATATPVISAHFLSGGSVSFNLNGGGGVGQYANGSCLLISSNHVSCTFDTLNSEFDLVGGQETVVYFNIPKSSGNDPVWMVYSTSVSEVGFGTYVVLEDNSRVYVDSGTEYNPDSQPVWSSVYGYLGHKWDAGLSTLQQYYFSGSVDFWLQVPPVPTPEPLVSYCSEIVPDGAGYEDGIFSFGGGTVYANRCMVIPEIKPMLELKSLSQEALGLMDEVMLAIYNLLSVWFSDDMGIDSWTLCFLFRDFRLYIMGFYIPYQEVVALGIFISMLSLFSFAGSGVRSLVDSQIASDRRSSYSRRDRRDD